MKRSISQYLNILISFAALLHCNYSYSQLINRQAVVQRHNVHVNKIDSLSSLSVGNGNFAFTVDATGMQSFLMRMQMEFPSARNQFGVGTAFPTLKTLELKKLKKFMSLKEERYLIPCSRRNQKEPGKLSNILELIPIVCN
jgi:hypothetical protein